jgi:hypothetical protein
MDAEKDAAGVDLPAEPNGEEQHTCRLFVRRTGWDRDCAACMKARAAAGVKVLPATEPGQRFYEVLHAFDKQEHPDTWAQLAASWKSVYANMERSFTSGVRVSYESQGEQHGNELDSDRRTTAADRGAGADLQHVTGHGQQQDSSGMARDPLRGRDNVVVGNVTAAAEQPSGAGLHQPLDAAAGAAEDVAARGVPLPAHEANPPAVPDDRKTTP